MKRKAYVAGHFYPASPEILTEELSRLCKENREKEDAIAIISPHAGYAYSGKVAGAVYSRVLIHDTVVILCPNHSGMGKRCAIMEEGSWITPMGEVPVNPTLSRILLDQSGMGKSDRSAHVFAHSLEVQLPFISFLKGSYDLVPVALKKLSLPECLDLGDALVSAIREYGKKVTIVASTDMTHYEPDGVARERDRLAIDKILSLDPEGLYTTVEEKGISMCGYVPTSVAIRSAIGLGATSGKLVQYATSGDESGDYQQVVGYAGIYLK